MKGFEMPRAAGQAATHSSSVTFPQEQTSNPAPSGFSPFRKPRAQALTKKALYSESTQTGCQQVTNTSICSAQASPLKSLTRPSPPSKRHTVFSCQAGFITSKDAHSFTHVTCAHTPLPKSFSKSAFHFRELQYNGQSQSAWVYLGSNSGVKLCSVCKS